MKRTLLLTALVAAFAAAPAPDARAAKTPPALATTQLPRTVRPLHYDIAVTPHAAALGFDGAVTVTVEVLSATSTITLNAVDLSFGAVHIEADRAGQATSAPPKVTVDANAQTATFTFSAPLPPGRYRLTMAYTGKIGTQPNGLFAIDYETATGKQRALFTQFENSDARRFIPCWDEPAYKATYALTVTAPAGQMVVSNMPAGSRADAAQGLQQVRFPVTPTMSSYLLFLGIGDFDRATGRADDTEIGVVTQKGKADQAAFALTSSQAVLHEYNAYFGVKYPLPKLDNIASPGRSQFFSAMENWGAIFTFEHTLLLDPAIASQTDRQRVFSVAAHEMAHQWFGDLVTMRWWDDLWLNEGFASWMAGRTTEKLHPEWNTVLDAVAVRAGAMARDAVATTHPVVQHVATVDQASQAFDAITYSKGQAVIHMLEAYVGPDAWRDGVRRYMKAHAYGNTVSDDLWREVEIAATKPITDIAHDFTLQPGIPLISVAAGACTGGRTPVTLTQGEFTRDRPGKAPLRWRVPLIADAGAGSVRALVTGGTATLSVPGCGPLVVNAGQTGYYRTRYAPALSSALRKAFAGLPPIDQLGVMDDAWALGLNGQQPVADYLDLAAATPLGADPKVWSSIAESLAALDGFYATDPARRAVFRRAAIARLAPVFDRVGWTARGDEPTTAKVLRGNLLRTLGALGDPAVVAEAQRRYAAQASDPAAVPAELRKTVLAIVGSHTDAAAWDRLHAAARAEKTPLVRDQLYAVLASPQDPALARRALDLALTDEPGATNSAAMVQMASRDHPDLAYDFAREHRAQIAGFIDPQAAARGYYAELARNSLDAGMVDKVRADAEATTAPEARRPAETVMAAIRYRRQVAQQRLPEVDAWLKKEADLGL